MSSQDAYNVVFGALIVGLFIFNNNLRNEIQELEWDALTKQDVKEIVEDCSVDEVVFTMTIQC